MKKLFFLFLTIAALYSCPVASAARNLLQRIAPATRSALSHTASRSMHDISSISTSTTFTDRHINQYSNEIKKHFPYALNDPNIKKFIKRERKKVNTHIACYHGHDHTARLIVDVFKMMYLAIAKHTLEKTNISEDIPIESLRPLGITHPYKNLDELMDNNPMDGDYDTVIHANVLSVNFPLFGGISFMSRPGAQECSIQFFEYNISCQLPAVRATFSKTFRALGFDTKNLDPLTDTIFNAPNGTNHGGLYQILIPKEDADTIILPSHCWGIPYLGHNNNGNKYMKFSSYKASIDNGSAPHDALDRVQGRILFTNEGMGALDGRIEIHQLHQNNGLIVHKKIRKLVNETVNNAFEKSKDDHSPALRRLCTTIEQNEHLFK